MAQKNRMKKLEAAMILLFAGICLSSCSTRISVPDDPPNILILLVDSLRADRLNDYGYFRNTNPFLSEFGKKGVRFTHAHSQSSHTKLSVASLFTGMIPPLHKVRHVANPKWENRKNIMSDVLSDDMITLAEVLKEEGYSTAALITNPHLRSFLGFSQGFKDYRYFPSAKYRAEEINEEAIQWLARQPKRPFFLYIHYMDVHIPYDPPSEYKYFYTKKEGMRPIHHNGPYRRKITDEQIAYTKALYDAQINYWDDCFRSLIERMEKKEALKNTLIIILSDHGEEFYDRGGFGHGFTLYEEELLVPLYIILEGYIPADRTESSPAQLIDIFPTVCHFLKIEDVDALTQGIDLFASDREKKNSVRMHYAETCAGKIPRSIQTNKLKLIFQSRSNDFQLFNLLDDPLEKTNLYREDDPQAKQLKANLFQLMNFGGNRSESETVILDPETIKELKSLGYIK